MSSREPHTPSRAFGRRLASLRTAAGLSQQDLADRLGLASPETVSRYERGDRTPRLSTVTRIAESLGVSTHALLPSSMESGPLPHDSAPETGELPDPRETETTRRLLDEGNELLRHIGALGDASTLALSVAALRGIAEYAGAISTNGLRVTRTAPRSVRTAR